MAAHLAGAFGGRIWRATLAAGDLRGQLDWTMAFLDGSWMAPGWLLDGSWMAPGWLLDGSFAPGKKGGDKVGLTGEGKGTKWLLVVDGDALSLGPHREAANRAEVRLAQQTLDMIRVARPRGRPKQRPEQLVA